MDLNGTRSGNPLALASNGILMYRWFRCEKPHEFILGVIPMFTRLTIATTILTVVGLSPPMTSAADVPGLKPGAKAPSFKLKDQYGKDQSLEALLKKGNVALVFFRSANW